MRKVLLALVIGAMMATAALADGNNPSSNGGQQGYEGQPGHQSGSQGGHGSSGYEGQPGNQGGRGGR